LKESVRYIPAAHAEQVVNAIANLHKIAILTAISESGVAFTGKFLAAGLVFLSVYMPYGSQAMVVLLIARFFGDWSLAAQWNAITDMSVPATATVFGLVNTVGALGMFAAGPVLGALKQHHAWEGRFIGATGMCLLSALTWLYIDCTRRLVDD
jgi:sugar phosphate permease